MAAFALSGSDPDPVGEGEPSRARRALQELRGTVMVTCVTVAMVLAVLAAPTLGH